MATDPLKLENLKYTILAIRPKAKQPPVGTLAKSKDQKLPPRSLSGLSFNYLISIELMFPAIFKKQLESVCYLLSPTDS